MTVIAWDGKTLAADRIVINGDTVSEATKIRRLRDGRVVAWTGAQAQGVMLMNLCEAGTLLEQWPAFQTKDEWARLIIADPNGEVTYFDQHPVPLRLETVIGAWGSGREVALGAMEMGADARQAVRVASKWIVSCGRGVDAFDLIDGQFIRR